MKKNVWIMNHYAGGMYFDRGGRHYSFAKYLRRAGYDPVVFCCNTKHNSNAECFLPMTSLWEEKKAEEIDVPFVFVQARPYAGNGKQRVLNMADFYRNVKKAAKEYAALHGRPDVIYASSVHPLTLVAGIRLAKHFGVKCICEVRDLWPESIVAYGVAGAHNPAVIALRRLEKWIYKKADAVVFTMEGAYDYISEQGWEKAVPRAKVHCINNGVDLETFAYNREHYTVRDADLDDPELFDLVFVGTLVVSNNIDGMLDLAKRLKGYPDIRILIWGKGVCKDDMLKRMEDEKITNVIYKGWIDKKYIPYIVSRASANFMHAAPTYLYRYGASPNKLFDYFAAEQPIIQDFTYNRDIVARYNCGFSFDWDLDQVVAAVEKLHAASSAERETLRQNCRSAAKEYEFQNLTRKLINVIEGEY